MAESIVERSVRGDTISSIGVMGAVTPVQGIDGLIKTNAAVTQTLSDLAKELKILNERGGTMGFGGSGQQDIARAVGDAVSDAMKDREPASPTRAAIGRQGAVDAPPMRPRPGGGGGMHTSGAVGLGELRQMFGESVERRLENRTWGPQLEQRGGQWINPAGINPIQANAQAAGFTLPWLSEGAPATAHEVTQFHHRESSMLALRGASQILSQGGTLRQAGAGALGGTTLGAGALKAAGIAGAVIHGAEQIEDFFVNQRAENAKWQSIMGGTNLGGIGERVQSNLFGLSQFGRLGADQAEQLYRGVAETGMRGSDRTRAQNFATQNFMNMGMGVQESLAVINVAARTGQESLSGLADALERVTESAASAGVNTEAARKSFVASWTSMTELVGGPAATSAALGITGASVGLGREYAGIGANLTETTLRMFGQQHGQDLNAYMLAMRADDTLLVTDYQANVRRQVERGLTAGSRAELARFEAIAKSRPLTEAEVEEVGNIVLSSANMDIGAAKQTMEQLFGVTDLTLANTPGYLGQVAVGAWNPVEEQQKAEAESATSYLGGSKSAFTTAKEGARGLWGGGLRRGPGGTPAQAAIQKEINELQRKVDASDQGIFDFSDSDIRQEYMADVLRTGRVGGISEAIATDANARNMAVKVRVMTPEGEKTVSMAEAMKNYREQLDAGTAVVVEGEMEGATIAQALDMTGDKTLAEGVAAASTGTAASVMLDGTPWLKKMIGVFSSNGPVSYDEAWGPPSTNIMPGQLPTGNP